MNIDPEQTHVLKICMVCESAFKVSEDVDCIHSELCDACLIASQKHQRENASEAREDARERLAEYERELERRRA